MLLVSLIGEQPLPNYLPIRHISPERALLVHTERTRLQNERLKNVLADHVSPNAIRSVAVHPYRLDEIFTELQQAIAEEQDVLFNITGGTKMMSSAAMLLAEAMQKPFLYYQSEKNQSRLYRYVIKNGLPQMVSDEDLEDDLFRLREYLKLYLGEYRVEGYHQEDGKLSAGGQFERAVAEALTKAGFEVQAGIRPEGEGNQLEIDLIFRLKNQVGIAELKLGDKESENIKKGIDQLTTAAQREYLGTYAHRFMIIARQVNNSIKKYAYRHGVKLVQLEDYRSYNAPGRRDSWQNKLINEVKQKMT